MWNPHIIRFNVFPGIITYLLAETSSSVGKRADANGSDM